jgi:phosphoribosyl 1,2-cyclic phosphodiesterase
MAGNAAEKFRIRFWGVRGGIACGGENTARYGGDTACVEMRCGEHLLIFDGGTGIRELGKSLCTKEAVDADIFFSHTHLDHICGIPFFEALYRKENSFRLWAGHLLPKSMIERTLRQMMMPPLFPTPLEVFGATIGFRDFTAGETLNPRPGVVIRTTLLNHPHGATGYRVEFNDRAVCYVTDTEHVEGKRDANVMALVGAADILVYDANFTDAEFPRHRGWGHSSWQEGVRIAEAAEVKTLILFHHDPAHDDDFLDRMGEAAKRRFPNAVVAREGMVFDL